MHMFHVTVIFSTGRKLSGCLMGRTERDIAAQVYEAGGLDVLRGSLEIVRL